MLKTNAVFHRKLVSIETQPCVIEAIEVMKVEDYEAFIKDLLSDRMFIMNKNDAMFVDLQGITHCLLVLNEEIGDGILVDSSGYNYARYVSFMPKIKSFVDQQIKLIANQIIEDAAKNTLNGSWFISFDEIKEQFDLIVNENNGIGTLLVSELEIRAEMAEIEAEPDGFRLSLYLDYCKNLSTSEIETKMEM